MICNYCGKEHEGYYGSGRFCSKECVDRYYAYLKKEEANRKRSETMKKQKLLNT